MEHLNVLDFVQKFENLFAFYVNLIIGYKKPEIFKFGDESESSACINSICIVVLVLSRRINFNIVWSSWAG